MKNLIILLSAGLMFTSCENVNGRLDVKEKISLKNKKGRNVVFQDGVTNAVLKFRSRKKLRMTIKEGPLADTKIDFKIPKDFSLDNRNGKFNLTASQINQAYDMKGRVTTETETSPLRDGSESCYETRTRRRCHQLRNGERTCTNDTIRIDERRFYTYFTEIDNKVFEINLTKPHTGDVVANFDGTRRRSRTVRLHSSACIPRLRNYHYGYRHCGSYGRFGRINCL